MTNHFDDDSFWDDPATFRTEATSQVTRVHKRVPERTRSHHVVIRDTSRPAPEPLDDASQEMWLEPAARFSGSRSERLRAFGSIDPRLLSVGAIAIAAVLAVPLLGAIRGGDDGDNSFRSVVEAEATTSTVAVTAAPTTVAEIVVTAAVNPDQVDSESEDSGTAEAESSAGFGDSLTSSSGSGGQQVAALRAPDGCTNRYEVAAGDFWLGIAQRADTDLDDLLAANGASSATAIYPGTEVCLPDGAAIGSGGSGGGVAPGGAGDGVVDPATCANTYDVVAGDYWVRIADASGTELADLLEVNGATNDTMLFPGKTICLPADAAPSSTSPSTTAAPTTAAPTTAPPTAAPLTTDPPITAASPTTDPTTTEAPETTQPQGPIPSGGEVEAMIREIWPDDLEEQALQIAWRESNYRPDVTSGSGCCVGVFQMHWEAHKGWMAGLGITSRDQLFDARSNIEAAYVLYQRNGWSPWNL